MRIEKGDRMKTGYFLTAGNKGFFLETNAKRKTAKVVDGMIDTIAKHRGLCEEWKARCKADTETRRRIAYEMSAATLDRMNTSIEAYRISGENFSACYPADDFRREIVLSTM